MKGGGLLQGGGGKEIRLKPKGDLRGVMITFNRDRRVWEITGFKSEGGKGRSRSN